MIWSPPVRTGSFASVRTTPTSPTWSIFICAAEPWGRDKLNEAASAASFRELVEADPRIDLARDVRRHRLRDLRRLAGVAEDPHELDVRRLRRHVLSFDDPGLEQVAAGIVDAEAHPALKGLRRHDDGDPVPRRPADDLGQVVRDVAQAGPGDDDSVQSL